MGAVEITYIGHSSFKIKTKTGTVVTDPYDAKMLGVKYPKVSADVITISHNHGDHNAAEAVMPTSDVKKIINGPGEYEVNGISILGLPSFHDNKKGALRGKNTIYVFEIEGFRIAHLGDLGHILSGNDIEAMGDINILMIPVGGGYTIDPGVAHEIVNALEPNIILPMHYKVPGLSEDTFGALTDVDEFLKLTALTVESIDKLILKDTLSEEEKIIKLAPQNG